VRRSRLAALQPLRSLLLFAAGKLFATRCRRRRAWIEAAVLPLRSGRAQAPERAAPAGRAALLRIIDALLRRQLPHEILVSVKRVVDYNVKVA